MWIGFVNDHQGWWEACSHPHYLTLKFVQPLLTGFPLVYLFPLTASTSLFSRLLTGMQTLLGRTCCNLSTHTSTSFFCLSFTFGSLCHFSEMSRLPLHFQLNASCLKVSTCKKAEMSKVTHLITPCWQSGRLKLGMTQDIPDGYTVLCDSDCPNTPALLSQHPNTSEPLALLLLHKAWPFEALQSCPHDARIAHSDWDTAGWERAHLLTKHRQQGHTPDNLSNLLRGPQAETSMDFWLQLSVNRM